MNEYSFSTISILILFKLAGLLITLLPFAFLFVYLYFRNSDWWVAPFLWVMATPVASYHDFMDIGRILQNYALGITFFVASHIATIGLFIWFAKFYLSRVKVSQ